jgi:hypothetical protein
VSQKQHHRQWRCFVYGVVSEVTKGDMLRVLGCLKHVLEMSENSSRKVAPEKDGGEPVEDHSDGKSEMGIQ